MKCSAMLGLLVPALLASNSAYATVIWKGDFQTGNLSQWTGTQEQASDRLQIVTSPVAAGERYALQVMVESGDLVSNGARAELTYEGDNPAEGDERYYHWQTYFPADFNAADYWQIFTQWHQYISGGSPPLAIMVWGNQIQLGNENAEYYWTTPLQLGEWHDFIIHVIWSSNASTGAVEVWYDGQHVLPLTPTATLFAGDTVYLKQGLYRKSAINYTQTLYDWGMTIATSLSDVLPNAQDAGTGGTAVDAGTGSTGGAPSDAGVTSGNGDAGSSEPGRGVPAADSGSEPPLVDAGTTEHDAGISPPESDAGSISDTDAGETGTSSTGGSTTTSSGTGTGSEITPKRSGCASTGDTWALALAVALGSLVATKRRRRTN
jgi:hypothetical protein